MSNKDKKPLCLELMDAKKDIFGVIDDYHQKHGIPFYLLESIVTDFARQVSNLANAEREKALADYNKES